MRYKPAIVSAFFQSEGLPPPQFEVRFLPDRKFRFDLAWPEQNIAVEVQGGIWPTKTSRGKIIGAHARGAGIRRDIEKHNLGVINGWRILYCEPQDLCTVKFAGMVKALMEGDL